MMKTTIAALAMALLISGCLCSGPTETDSTQNTESTEETTQEGTADTLEQTATTQPSRTTLPTVTTVKSGIINDLTAAMTSGVTYRCTYTYENVKSEMFIKGKKFYMQTTADGQTSNMISDGTWAYMWTPGQKQGMKINLQEAESNPTPSAQQPQDINQIAQSAVNVQCAPDLASDNKFVPPTGVEFQDLNEMMAGLQNMQGFNIPKGPTG